MTSLETKIHWVLDDNVERTPTTTELYLPGTGDLRIVTRAQLEIEVRKWSTSRIIRLNNVNSGQLQRHCPN